MLVYVICFISNSICNIPCFQASEWEPFNRSITWRAWSSSKLGHITNWWEQYIRINTSIIFKFEQNEAFVSIFQMLYHLKTVLQWFTLLLHLARAVTWTTIQLVGKFPLSYPDYQVFFTCKLVIGHILIFYDESSVCAINEISDHLQLWTCSLLDNNNLSGYLPAEFSELPSLLILYGFYFPGT